MPSAIKKIFYGSKGIRLIWPIVVVILFVIFGELVLIMCTTTLPAQTMLTVSEPCTLKVIQRDTTITEVRNKLEELIQQPMPEKLTKEQAKNWEEQTQWLKSVSGRLAAYQEKQKQSFKQSGPAQSMKFSQPEKAAVQQKEAAATSGSQPDQEFLSLQNSIQMESREMHTLSNAAKARHDAATAIVRNLK